MIDNLTDSKLLITILYITVNVVFSVILTWIIIKVVARQIEIRNLRINTESSYTKVPLFLLTLIILFNSTHQWINLSKASILLQSKANSILIIILISWLTMRAIVLLRVFIEDKYDIENENNLKARKVYTQLRIIQRIMIILVVIIALGSILISFDKIRQLGISIFASAGIAGIVIGFAAQKMIASFIAGLQIALTQPIRIDDAVFVEGQWGWIEEITITYVVVRIWDKRRLIVPSTYFIENSFQNWTRNSSDIMGTVFIYADYGFPVDALRKKLTGLLRKNPKWDKKVNVIQVTDATEKTKEMRILVSAKNSPTLWDLRVELREKLIDFIRDEYPQHLPHSRVLLKNNIADYSTGESA